MELIFKKLNRYFSGKWRLAVFDSDVGRWVIEPKTLNISYLKAENANGRHILILPEPEVAPYYLLIDDVTWPMIQRYHHYPDGTWKPALMVVETSQGNYQVLIRSSTHLFLNEKRYWLQKLSSDPGADPNNRGGRCAGFRNRKEKYRDSMGGYPLSRLIWLDWKGQAEIPQSNYQTSRITSLPFSPQPQERGVSRYNDISGSDYGYGYEYAIDFLIPLPSSAEGTLMMTFDSVFSENELTRKTIWENEERSITWIKQSNGRG